LRDFRIDDTHELMHQAQPPSWYQPPEAPLGSSPHDPHTPGAPDERWRHQTAGWGIRAGARIIDNIVGLVVGAVGGAIGGVIVGVLGAMGVLGENWQALIGQQSAGAFLLSAIGGLSYHTIAEGLGGASIGKLVCGLRTIGTDGRPCSLAGAFKRSLAFYVDGFFFGLVAYSAMSKSVLNQRIGDRWGHTAVVRAPAVPATEVRGAAVGILSGVLVWGALIALSTILKCI
jgi:uncharacterized RDD family membrane protein YckC